MQLAELKRQVARGAYRVDERLVADALVRRIGLRAIALATPLTLDAGSRSPNRRRNR